MAESPARAGRSTAAGAAALGLAVAVRPGDALGFRLAGVPTEEVPPGGEAQSFRRLLSDARLGVLAVEEDLLAAVPARTLGRARGRGLPVILPFALPRTWGEEGRGRAYVAALIRRAVGYAVKIAGGGAP